MAVAEVLPHYDAVLALLNAIPDMAGYDAEVHPTPPLDPDGRVHPYWVFYSGGGMPVSSSLCGTSNDLVWPFTVVVVGGDQGRVLWGRDRVVAALVDVEPAVVGRVSGRVRLDYEVGPPRRVDDVQPPRFGMPLLFTLDTSPA